MWKKTGVIIWMGILAAFAGKEMVIHNKTANIVHAVSTVDSITFKHTEGPSGQLNLHRDALVDSVAHAKIDSITFQETDCSNIEDVTSKVYFTFVIHNEEDDANGVPGSIPTIPDYNGNKAVFDHFAGAMMDYAKMLQKYGATLSFQPDWTFIEGAMNFRPSFFPDLEALGNVEVIPHAHETIVPLDSIYKMEIEAGAHPRKQIGGMTVGKYMQSEDWFNKNPGWSHWTGPFQSPGHVGDASPPPFAFRIPLPADVSETIDLYKHVASSPVVVTGSIPSAVNSWSSAKPTGAYISSSYWFEATRFFMAESDDQSVPAQWRKVPGNVRMMTSAEKIAKIETALKDTYLPLQSEGKLEFMNPGEVVDMYKRYEHCLDLVDGQDLSGYAK
ncbi:MAG: hypothetical protein HQK83_02890 [Fibrobacteria bacterium]|nr:hypothetical protein [Fibrobacteria bacterium]